MVDGDKEPAGRRAGARTTMQVLAASEDVFESFFEGVRIGLALADLSGHFIRVNRTYAELLGRLPEDLVGVSLSEVLHGLEGHSCTDLEALLSGRTPTLSAQCSHLRARGERVWVMHGVATAAAADGEPGWFAVSAQDVTERRSAELELRALTDTLAERAVRDQLTGLANRGLLEERLQACLARDARTGETTGVLFLDLDGFKQINDRHGHAAGDQVLRQVAARLTAVVRPSDTVARFGGDEFVVLVEQATVDALDNLMPRVITEIRKPLALPTPQSSSSEEVLELGVSVGSAVSTSGSSDVQGLLAQADERMYAAKRAVR